MAQLQSTGITGSFNVTGTVTAQEFHTEFISGSIIFVSGSTKFGDTSNDIHSFSGSLQVSGSGNHFFTDGRVGIGTTSPGTVLDIHGEGNVLHVGTGTNTSQHMSFRGSGASGAYIGYDGTGMLVQPGESKRFLIRAGHGTFGSGTTALTVDTSCKVGIGTTSPNAKFHIDNPEAWSAQNLGSSSSGSVAFRITGRSSATNDLVISSNGLTNYAMQVVGDAVTSGQLHINPFGGNVGIGTSSPSTELHVEGSGEILRIDEASATGSPFMTFFQNGTRRSLIQHLDSGDLLSLVSEYGGIRMMTGTSGTEVERMRIDASGSVGIGVTDPAVELEVGGSTNTQILISTTNTTGNSQLYFGDSDSDSSGIILYRHASDSMAFEVNGGERMRIDSSGNVLVGKTTTSNATAGIELNSTGQLVGTFASGTHILGRNTDDGAILSFAKDNSTVGSIGTSASSLYIGGDGNGAIYFNGTTDIRPWNKSTQANLDNSINLGTSSARFKDLYLGGDALVGGNVGIGTTNPENKLHLVDTSNPGNTSGSIIIEGRRDGTANLLTLRAKDASAPTLALPNGQGSVLRWQGFDGTDFENMGYILVNADGQAVANGDAPSFMAFGTSGDGSSSPTERMRIDSSGNVGIGTSSPTQALQVAGAVKVTSNFSGETSANSGYFDFFSGATRITSKGADGSTLGAFSILQQASDGSPASTSFHIDTSGNVGIGTTAPGAKLEVAGDTKLNGDLDFSGGTAKKIKTGSQRAYTLPAQGTRMRLLTVETGTSCRVYLDSSENGFNQPIVLEIFYKAQNTTSKPQIRRLDNYQYHAHSNDIIFTSDAAGTVGADSHIYAEKVNHATGRSVNIRKVEEFKGSVTILDGSTTDTNGGTDETIKDAVFSNVGIGTTSPSKKLEVHDASSTTTANDGGATIVIKNTNDTDNNQGSLSFLNSAGTKTASIISTFIDHSTDEGALSFAVGDGGGSFGEAMRIDSSGKVGIGTSSPAYKLHLFDDTVTSSTKTLLQFDSNNISNGGGYNIDFRTSSNDTANRFISRIQGAREGDGATSQLSFWTDNGSSLNQRMTIMSSGNVGIGTTSPGHTLHVSSTGGTVARFEHNDGTAAFIQLKDTSNSVFLGMVSDAFVVQTVGDSYATKLTVTDSGNVGIGTSIPTASLHVEGVGYFDGGENISFNDTVTDAAIVIRENDFIYTRDGDNLRRLIGKDSSDRIHVGATGTSLIDEIRFLPGTTGGKTTFFDDTTELMRVSGSGVGIGTQTPSHPLHVRGASTVDTEVTYAKFEGGSSSQPSLSIGGNNTTTVGNRYAFIQAEQSDGTPTTHLILNKDGGNVGIGTTSPANHISGTETSLHIQNSNVASINLDSTGGKTYVISSTAGNNFSIFDDDAGKYRLTISGGGHVGIGTSSPDKLLHVSSSNNSTPVRFEIGSNAKYDFKANSTSLYTTTFNVDDTGLDIGHDSSGRSLNLQTDSTDRLTILGGGNVGIGTTSPGAKLQVEGDLDVRTASNKNLHIRSFPSFDNFSNQGVGLSMSRTSSDADLMAVGVIETDKLGLFSRSGIIFATGGANAFQHTSEAVRIDGSGNVGIGTTSPENNLHIAGDSSVAMTLQAPTHNSSVASTATMNFKYQSSGGSAIGKIELVEKSTNSFSGKFVFGLPHSSSGQATRDVLTIDTDGTIFPALDDTADIGSSSKRFDNIFATNTTVTTSDRNQKQDFEQITEAEAKVAQKAKGLLTKYKLIKDVQKYGDDAQYHIGIIAQDLIAAFEEEGLDYKKYAMIYESEHLEDSGEITKYYGVRYTELLAFIITTL